MCVHFKNVLTKQQTRTLPGQASLPVASTLISGGVRTAGAGPPTCKMVLTMPIINNLVNTKGEKEFGSERISDF